MNVCIIGCGNIGSKRARVVAESQNDHLTCIVESNAASKAKLEKEFAVPVLSDPAVAIASKEVDCIIISTPPESHIPLIKAALEAGKHVLCEKPLGNVIGDVEHVTQLAGRYSKVLKCGFNLRHDVGLCFAFDQLSGGELGRLNYFKASYVNGCVLVNTNRVGALKDMGSHILDLANWFCDSVSDLSGCLQRSEYELNKDDNGFLIFKNNTGVVGQIHFSFTRWQNDFQLELGCEKGTIEVKGLPKWGAQTVVLHKRIYPSGCPKKVEHSFTDDQSWSQEWRCFKRLCNANDLSYNEHGLAVARQIDSLLSATPLTQRRENYEN